MARAFVLGNGVSRLQVDLQNLKHFGPIYGCNALYRDFVPTALVATDKPIAQRIQDSGYALQHRFYTRKPIDKQGALPVPQRYYGYSSGPIATAIAALDGAKRIFLIGFDMGPINHNRFNNVYADTEFYKKSSAQPTYVGNWANQLATIMKDFGSTEFVRIMGETTAHISNFVDCTNFKTMGLTEFVDRINNSKDL